MRCSSCSRTQCAEPRSSVWHRPTWRMECENTKDLFTYSVLDWDKGYFWKFTLKQYEHTENIKRENSSFWILFKSIKLLVDLYTKIPNSTSIPIHYTIGKYGQDPCNNCCSKSRTCNENFCKQRFYITRTQGSKFDVKT